MRTLKINRDSKQKVIENAIKILTNGGMLVYPTETCYGIGVDATNQAAVDKLLKYKRRPEGKAISIAVTDESMAEKYVEVNATARNLYKNFLPGPLTIVSKSRGIVAKGLEAEDGTLGVRIPDYPLALDIIKAFGKPITATSANVSHKKTPYSVDDILSNTTKKQQELIDLILDAGELPKNPPSTVVNTTMNDITVLRKGKVDFSHENIKTQKHISHSEQETRKIAEETMENVKEEISKKCIIFALQGELGVGKTQFAKGVARALGVKENVVSPTYILVREYEAVSNHHYMLYHIDTWRMRESEELLDLGFYNMLKPGNVVVIEWLEKVRGILEEVERREDVKVVWVEIKHRGKESRRIVVMPFMAS